MSTEPQPEPLRWPDADVLREITEVAEENRAQLLRDLEGMTTSEDLRSCENGSDQ